MVLIIIFKLTITCERLVFNDKPKFPNCAINLFYAQKLVNGSLHNLLIIQNWRLSKVIVPNFFKV